MPTLTGTLSVITGGDLDPTRVRQVVVRAPDKRASLGTADRLVTTAPARINDVTGEISVDLEPGPALLIVNTMDSNDVYELYVTADMTLLTEAANEAAPAHERSWVESQLVQLRTETETLAGDAVTAAGTATSAAGQAAQDRAHVDSIRQTLDEAAQSNVAPYLTQSELNATYGSASVSEARAQSKLLGKKLALVLRHDDVQASAMNYLPLYDELGVKASWFVATQHMGTVQRGIQHATAADIQALHDAGHEIGSHTQHHFYFEGSTEAQRRAELVGSKRDLETMLGGGYKCETFAYPGNMGTFDKEVGDYYIWGTTGKDSNEPHGLTHTATEIDTVSNRAEYPDPLVGATVAETITKTQAVIQQYKARESLTVFTLQTHNLNELPLEHMRAILETVLADPDSEVATMREVAHFVRSTLSTRDGRFYGPVLRTKGDARRELVFDGTKAADGAYIADRVGAYGNNFVSKVGGVIQATLDSILVLARAGASRLENGHRLMFYSASNAENVSVGHESGGIFTINPTGGQKRVQLRGNLRLQSDGTALAIHSNDGTEVMVFDATKRSVRLWPVSSFPSNPTTWEICNRGGLLYIYHASEWFPLGNPSGTTAARPTAARVGQMYFDRTLGKPIWLKAEPSTWVDATGAGV
ncbi:polysaccharide deacetylase family protein [Dietzia maris]